MQTTKILEEERASCSKHAVDCGLSGWDYLGALGSHPHGEEEGEKDPQVDLLRHNQH